MNTVPKGTNRPAAAARTRKAAQRTPLPPRAGQVEDAQDAIEQTRPGAQPRKALNSRERKANPKRTTQPYPSEAARKPIEPSPGGTKSETKAQAFVSAASSLGWSLGSEKVDGEATTVTVERAGESIEISWMRGVFESPCIYSFSGRTVKLNNASAARKRMETPAEAATQEAARVAAKSIPRKTSAPQRARALPFTEASLDQDVINAIEGRKISWTNAISGETESDYVPAPAQGKGARAGHTKISEGKRGRTLTFCGAGGFHDVLVSAITRVGR